MASCSGWCPPTLIYVAIMVIGLLSTISTMATDVKKSGTDKVELILKMLIFGLIWVAILYSLCYYCHPNLAWGLLLLKLIFVVGVMAMVLAVVLSQNQRR